MGLGSWNDKEFIILHVIRSLGFASGRSLRLGNRLDVNVSRLVWNEQFDGA